MEFQNLKERLRQSLEEDKAIHHDVTTRCLPRSQTEIISASLLSKSNGVFCGAFLQKPLFRILDSQIMIRSLVKDGYRIKKGQILARLKGRANAILGGERVYLNLACHLSGISTLTQKYVHAIRETTAKIFDTRKTLPLWRDLEKFAVRCGGGENHRFSLGDAILIKDNHLQVLRNQKMSVAEVFDPRNFRKIRKNLRFVELEAKTFSEVWDGIKIRADVIMLDNMSVDKIKGAVVFIKAARAALSSSTPFIEVSGGVTLFTVRALAKLGIDRISVGALTHSAPALDFSLEVY